MMVSLSAPIIAPSKPWLSPLTFRSLHSQRDLESLKKAGAPSPRRSIVCEAAPAKKPDSAVKRARQAERRVYNKARKSEIKTRMRKVFEELVVLKKKTEAQLEEILPIEKLISEAYSTTDVKMGTLHRNTGAHRKSRFARRKKAVEIHRGWYTPTTATAV